MEGGGVGRVGGGVGRGGRAAGVVRAGAWERAGRDAGVRACFLECCAGGAGWVAGGGVRGCGLVAWGTGGRSTRTPSTT